MSRLTRFAKAINSEVKAIPGGFPPIQSSPWFWRPGVQLDESAVGKGAQNSIVLICLQILANGFAEAPLGVAERIEQEWDFIEEHPFTNLWQQPNEFMTDSDLVDYITYATRLDGNAYVHVTRNGFGDPIELWPLLPDMVEPRLFNEGFDGRSSNKFIDYYEYTPFGFPQRLPVEDVIHIKHGLDPSNHRKGLAPLKAVLREILGDEEAALFSASLLKNMGVPGVILTPSDPTDPGPTEAQADLIKENFQRNFGGRNRGAPLVTSGMFNVEVVSYSPQEMDLRSLRRLPEERIAAILGVPAVLAELGAGLDRNTMANNEEAGVKFTTRTLVPGWRRIEKQLSAQFATSYGFSSLLRPRFDTTDVQALAENRDLLFTRLNAGVAGGWLTVADARRAAGLDVDDWHDIFLRGSAQVEVPNTAEALEPPEVLELPDVSFNGSTPQLIEEPARSDR